MGLASPLFYLYGLYRVPARDEQRRHPGQSVVAVWHFLLVFYCRQLRRNAVVTRRAVPVTLFLIAYTARQGGAAVGLPPYEARRARRSRRC